MDFSYIPLTDQWAESKGHITTWNRDGYCVLYFPIKTGVELENLKSKIILQVHDELIIEAPINEVEQVKKILENEMQKVTKLKVPLKVDINVGDKWIESH